MATSREWEQRSSFFPGNEFDHDYAGGTLSPNNSEDDPLRDFTEDGQRRADSEARRRWNYICSVGGCNQRFNRPCRLEAHMRSHNNERPFACDIDGCDKTFPRRDHLNRHVKSFHIGIEPKFVCDWEYCYKTFKTNARLRRHKDTHNSKFHCTGYPPCTVSFKTWKSLEAHIQAKHLETIPFPCDYVDVETGEQCSSGYQTEPALRKHKNKKHAEEPDAVYFCMRCPARGSELDPVDTAAGDVQVATEPLPFSNYEELVAHTREFHPPTCSECDQKFTDQAALKQHFQLEHTDPVDLPEIPCPRGCGRIFTRSGNLNTHIRNVHDRLKRYFCDPYVFGGSKHDDLREWDGAGACGVGYTTKAELMKHVRLNHLGHDNRESARKAGNVAKVTKAKPRRVQKKPDPSTLRLLTGIGFDGGRAIPCFVEGCEFRFFIDRDLRRHLCSPMHGMSKEYVEEIIRERDALHGGHFWTGGLEEQPIGDLTTPPVPQTADPSQSIATNSTVPQTTDPSQSIATNPSVPQTTDPFQTIDTNPAALQPQDSLENIDTMPTVLRTPGSLESIDMNPTMPQTTDPFQSFDTNPTVLQLPNSLESMDLNPTVVQTPDPFQSIGTYPDFSNAPYDAPVFPADLGLDIVDRQYETFETTFFDEGGMLDEELGLANFSALDVNTSFPMEMDF